MPEDKKNKQQPRRRPAKSASAAQPTSAAAPAAKEPDDVDAVAQSPQTPSVSTDEPDKVVDASPSDDDQLLATMVMTTGALGTLTLHYAERDVAMLLDGPSAMRLLTMLVRRREGLLGDRMSPTADPAAAWFVFDVAEPLAASWRPGVPQRRRAAVDPKLPQLA